MCQKLTTTSSVLLELDDPDNPSYFANIKNGEVYLEALRLRNLLELELLRNFEFREFSGFRVHCQELFNEPAPQDWKKRVHGTKINMANIGFYKGDFVLWGQMMSHGNKSFYRPYIILVGLASPRQVVALQAKWKEVVNSILEMLRLHVQDYEKFANSEDELYVLKTQLQQILKELR